MSQYIRDTGNHRLPLYQSITYAIGPTLFWIAVVVFVLWLLPARAWRVSTQGVIILGVLGVWRYGWQLTNLFRAIIYRRLAYPLLRDEVDAQEEPFPERVYFMIPSYKEEERVSDLTFEAVVREASMIPSRVTAVISVAEDPEEPVAGVLDFRIEFADRLHPDLVDGLVEADHLLKLLRIRAGELLGRGVGLEEILGDDVDPLVRRLRGENRRHQQLERAVVIEMTEARSARNSALVWTTSNPRCMR